MAFLVKALFLWKEYSINADISVLSNFLAFFSNFFLDIEKFYQVLFTCQIGHQLNHSNRNYRGGGGGAESALPQPYQSAKSPACLGLIRQGPRRHSLRCRGLTLRFLPESGTAVKKKCLERTQNLIFDTQEQTRYLILINWDLY